MRWKSHVRFLGGEKPDRAYLFDEGYRQFKSIVVNCIYSALIILFCCYIIKTNLIYHSDSCIFILYTAITPWILYLTFTSGYNGSFNREFIRLAHLRFPNKSKKLLQGPTQFVGNAKFLYNSKIDRIHNTSMEDLFSYIDFGTT